MAQQSERLGLKGDFFMPTIDEAVQWVAAHSGLIIEKAREYTKYTPYDVDDYIQDAYHAAVEASLCCLKNPKLKFGAAFWTIYKRFVAKVTPLPDIARAESKKKKTMYADGQSTVEVKPAKPFYSGGTSMSFPKVSQVYPTLESFKKTQENKKVNLDKVVENLRHLWSPRELAAMELALGLTKEGCLSIPEIARKLDVGIYSAREYVGRAIKKVENLKNVVDFPKQRKKSVITESVELMPVRAIN